MNGPEHYREAERLLAQAETWENADTGWKAGLSGEERLARKQADASAGIGHALLALAAAQADHMLVSADAHGVRTPIARYWSPLVDPQD